MLALFILFVLLTIATHKTTHKELIFIAALIDLHVCIDIRVIPDSLEFKRDMSRRLKEILKVLLGYALSHLDLSRCLFAAPKFATSTLMTASLKVVTIECIEHDVTCLNERGFIKTMNLLLTNCSQSTLLAMICRLSLLVLNTS